MDSAGNLYVGTDGAFVGQNSFYSLDPVQCKAGSSGCIRWQKSLGGKLAEKTPAVSLGNVSLGTTDVIYIANDAGDLYAFNPDGTSPQNWGTPYPTGASSSQAPLAVANSGTVYFKTSLGLFAINPDKTPKWPSPFSPGGDAITSRGPVVDAQENIYVAFGDNVYKVDSKTGNVPSNEGWPVSVPGAGPLVIGGNGVLYVVSQGQKLYSISDGFLSFPLAGLNPESAEISSVFDHSQRYPYAGDGVVMTYTGECGTCGTSLNQQCRSPVGIHGLFGFPNSAGKRFGVNRHYTGGDTCPAEACPGQNCPPTGGPPPCSKFLFYDGHPGFDYPAACGTPVYAAISGKVHYPPSIPGANGPKYHILQIVPDPPNAAYRVYYLHLSNYTSNNCRAVGCTCPFIDNVLPEGASVKAGDLVGYSGDAGVPSQRHLHFEVQFIGPTTQGIPVDPYGWTFNGPDPYAHKNIRLWK